MLDLNESKTRIRFTSEDVREDITGELIGLVKDEDLKLFYDGFFHKVGEKKENENLFFHDLKKNPNDLPPKIQGERTSDFVITVGDTVCLNYYNYYYNDKGWLRDKNIRFWILYPGVIS